MDLLSSCAFAWLAGVKKDFQKSVTLKMRLSPWKVGVRDAGLWRLAATISMLLLVRALGGRGRGVPGKATDLPFRVLQEDVGDGSALAC